MPLSQPSSAPHPAPAGRASGSASCSDPGSPGLASPGPEGAGHAPLARELITLLHDDAPSAAFAGRLAMMEALPDDTPRKAGLIELVRMAMALRNRLELHEERERGMLAVIESAQDLAGQLDLTELLKAIVARARKLLGAHLCWLTIYDAEAGEFRVVVADGAISEPIGRMTAQRHRGVAGIVMSTRLPFSTPHYLQDGRFVHDPVLDDTFRQEGVAGLVGAPLICNDEVTGLLFVADRYHRTHTAHNISILCTLATHAAVAINNAKAFADARAAVDRADAARAELERHASEVQGAVQAHEALTSLLARGASLADLCQSVARLLRGDIVVLDEARQLISRGGTPEYAGAAASNYEPYGPHSAALSNALQESRQAGRSVVAYSRDGEHCRVSAVIGGGGVLGAVLLFRREALSETAIRTFERSSSVIGVMLLSQERIERSRHRDAAALLQTLISPHQGEPALARQRAERHGIDLAQPLALMLVEPEHPEPAFLARRLHIALALPDVILDDIDGVLVLACPATRAQTLLDAFEDFARRELGTGYRGVLSRPANHAGQVPALYSTLRRALAVAARLGMTGRIVNQHELTLYSVLFESQDAAGLNLFLQSTIGPVMAQDRARGSALAATLLAYFDCGQNARTTAARLGIHVNTVRQRLASAESLIGPWGNAGRSLEIQMALRLWHIGITGKE